MEAAVNNSYMMSPYKEEPKIILNILSNKNSLGN